MTLRNCNIIFDNRPYGVFFSGESVAGSVNLLLENNKQCQALMIKISGEAKCRWSESHGTGKRRRTVYFTGNELYFKTHNNLMAEQHIQTGTSDLNAGNHTFRFALNLPPNLPSSCEGIYGNVRYTAKVTLKRSFKIDLCYKVLFTVLSHVDLNITPNVQLAVVNESMKTFYFLVIKKGTLFMTIQIPASGFVSGQCIPVTCHLQNKSKIKVDSVKVGLVKTIIFTATFPYTSTRVETVKVSRSLGGGADSGEEKTFDLPLPVPALPPTSFRLSNVIEVEYKLTVSAVVSGLHGNLKSTTPIVIGTIPIRTCRYANVEPEQSTSSYNPSAPPLYNELLPPSYEEVLVDKRMEESHEEWDHSNEFSPRYPVYNFNVDEKKEKDFH